MSYLRMTTHPAIFSRPMADEEAARDVEALLATPTCRVIPEEEGFWDVYREVTKDLSTKATRCQTPIWPCC